MQLDASMYIPGAGGVQAAVVAAANPEASQTPAASGTSIGFGITGNPGTWVLLLMLAWAGLVHLGISVDVGIGEGG